MELEKVVGIVAGQSTGELGAQLMLRTFHTSSIFIEGTVEYICAPFEEKIKFNEDLVHIPVVHTIGILLFLCYIDLGAIWFACWNQKRNRVESKTK